MKTNSERPLQIGILLPKETIAFFWVSSLLLLGGPFKFELGSSRHILIYPRTGKQFPGLRRVTGKDCGKIPQNQQQEDEARLRLTVEALDHGDEHCPTVLLMWVVSMQALLDLARELLPGTIFRIIARPVVSTGKIMAWHLCFGVDFCYGFDTMGFITIKPPFGRIFLKLVPSISQANPSDGSHPHYFCIFDRSFHHDPSDLRSMKKATRIL